MAFTATSLYAATRGALTSHASNTFACAAGDLLICGHTFSDPSADWSGITDDSGSGSWSLISSDIGAAHGGAWWYKIANGSETTVTVSLSKSATVDFFVDKVTGYAGTLTLEDSKEDVSYMSSAASSSFGSGSVTNTTASAMVVMFAAVDGSGTVEDSKAVSDGSSYTNISNAGQQAYSWYREVSSTGTYSPVYSFSDTGDQVYGASAVFGDVSAGGGFKSAWARGANSVIVAGRAA